MPIEAINLTYTTEPDIPDTEESDVPLDAEPDTPDLPKPPEELEENILAGDVDGNGRITENDGLLVLQFVAGLYKLSEAEQKASDADQNGVVNVADAAIIFMIIKKMEV